MDELDLAWAAEKGRRTIARKRMRRAVGFASLPLLAMIGLVAVQSALPPPLQVKRRTGASYAFFEFAPESGAYMGTACGACNNSALSSEQLNNTTDWPDWSAAMPRTANYAVAPDGSPSAERIVFAATTAGTRSAIYQDWTASGVISGSVYVKGTSGSGSIRVALYTGAARVCTTCSFNPSTWTLCANENVTTTAAQMALGNINNACPGGVDEPEADVLLWGAQLNAGATANTYGPHPKGAAGETLTFTRASAGYCTKSNETSGIANGDLVECGRGQPRVMPGGDGTGGLGLSVWEARTNALLRSQEFDNAVWTKIASGAVVPVVTANYAVAPDGTTTAERLVLPATSGTQYSMLYGQNCTTGTGSGSVFAKGNGDAGTLTIGLLNDVGWQDTESQLSATTWTRLVKENVTRGTAIPFKIGNDSSADGGSRTAQDVLIWQADCQAGATISPPIKTEGTAQTRVAEVAYFEPAGIATTLPTGGTVSAAATAVTPAPLGLTTLMTGAQSAGHCAPSVFIHAGPVNSGFKMGSGNTALAAWVSGQHRISGYGNSTERAGFYDGIQVTTAGSSTIGTAVTRVELGLTSCAGNWLNGVIKKVCLDPSPTRCR